MNMPTRNETLFSSIASSVPTTAKIRRSDLAFLRGIDLQHPYAENILKSAKFVKAEIHRDNVSADGIIYIRVTLEIRIAEEGALLKPESAVLWIGSDEFVALDGVKEIPEYEFDFKDAADLMVRFGLEW